MSIRTSKPDRTVAQIAEELWRVISAMQDTIKQMSGGDEQLKEDMEEWGREVERNMIDLMRHQAHADGKDVYEVLKIAMAANGRKV